MSIASLHSPSSWQHGNLFDPNQLRSYPWSHWVWVKLETAVFAYEMLMTCSRIKISGPDIQFLTHTRFASKEPGHFFCASPCWPSFTLWLWLTVCHGKIHPFFYRQTIYFYGPSIPWRTVSHNQMVYRWFMMIYRWFSHRNRWFSQRTKPPFMVGIFHITRVLQRSGQGELRQWDPNGPKKKPSWSCLKELQLDDIGKTTCRVFRKGL